MFQIHCISMSMFLSTAGANTKQIMNRFWWTISSVFSWFLLLRVCLQVVSLWLCACWMWLPYFPPQQHVHLQPWNSTLVNQESTNSFNMICGPNMNANNVFLFLSNWLLLILDPCIQGSLPQFLNHDYAPLSTFDIRTYHLPSSAKIPNQPLFRH